MTSVSKPLTGKVPIDMNKYKSLGALGKEGAGPIVSSVFAMLDDAVACNYHDASEKYFGVPIQDLMKQMLEAVFDYKGIADFIPDKDNANALSDLYGHEINPLYSAFSKTNLMNHDTSKATFEEKFGLREDEFTIKRFFQGLLFYSYYCSLPDLAQHLMTSDYYLMEKEKDENILKLIELRPMLRYQQAIGIVPGKLYPDTGFFDGGSMPEDKEKCPSCKMPASESLIDLGEEFVCTHCKGAFKK